MTAYIIVQGEVHDSEAYKWYAARSPGVVEKYKGKFLVRGGALATLEGPEAQSRMVVLEFPDLDAAKAFYYSPEYTELRNYRAPYATLSFIAADGFEG